MSSLQDLFGKINIPLYQNETLDLDHFYPEPYQDNDVGSDDSYDMSEPYETNKSKKKHSLSFEPTHVSNFMYFMDGSRRTYKIGDIVLENKKIYPVVVAQVRAGCVQRSTNGKIHCQYIEKGNLLLISSAINNEDFSDLRTRIRKSPLASELCLDVITYRYDRMKDLAPANAAIAKANSVMHDMEIRILERMVKSGLLSTGQMLIVDGPIQFVAQDRHDRNFSDLFYNVIGVSKSFDPMLPMSEKTRGSAQVGSQLLKLEYGERTPVFLNNRNNQHRRYGCWYLRIRPKAHVLSPLDGIIKIEKLATDDDYENGLDSDIVDNLSRSLLEECSPTCHGSDDRWPNHLYPVFLAETMVKATFLGDLFFMSQFRRNF